MKQRSDKTTKELRQEIEILRAQVKSLSNGKFDNEVSSPLSKIESSNFKLKTQNIAEKANMLNVDILIENSYIKKQLSSTLVLSAMAFAIIAGFYFYGFDKFIDQLNIK